MDYDPRIGSAYVDKFFKRGSWFYMLTSKQVCRVKMFAGLEIIVPVLADESCCRGIVIESNADNAPRTNIQAATRAEQIQISK